MLAPPAMRLAHQRGLLGPWDRQSPWATSAIRVLAPPMPSDPAGPFDPGRPRGRVLISRANPLSTLVSRASFLPHRARRRRPTLASLNLTAFHPLSSLSLSPPPRCRRRRAGFRGLPPLVQIAPCRHPHHLLLLLLVVVVALCLLLLLRRLCSLVVGGD
jgi:hypothetical protein